MSDRLVDVMTPEQRSRCMSRIRDRDTKPEIALRKTLWARGLRYRLRAKVPGRPDIAFPSRRVAVFVDGCFWHGCPAHGVIPKTNAEFWRKKIGGNVERDTKVNQQLKGMGWRVCRYWEHELKDDLDTVVADIESALS